MYVRPPQSCGNERTLWPAGHQEPRGRYLVEDSWERLSASLAPSLAGDPSASERGQRGRRGTGSTGCFMRQRGGQSGVVSVAKVGGLLQITVIVSPLPNPSRP